MSVVHLRAGGVSVVLDCRGTRLPVVVHWGADLGAIGDRALADLVTASLPPAGADGLDVSVPVTVLPDNATGWRGLPGLSGHRDGVDFSPSFTLESVQVDETTVSAQAHDKTAALDLTLVIELTSSGLVRARADLRNAGPSSYTIDGLVLALPVPTEATELLDLTGHHCAERIPQRHAFTQGAHVRDGRRGRTGFDATLLMVAGTPGFGFRAGETWAVHTAWSGNHRTYAERLPDGTAVLGGGELLLPGEVRLEPGKSYRSPWIFGAYGGYDAGLDELASRFHAYLRQRPQHPVSPRPVVLNTWEAVYFDHDLDKLTKLADTAAEVGVERFVLDDGWFGGRRDDRAGLGDWYVSADVWPKGLHPLVDHVVGLGLEFGLWVEPEMVNPDSGLAREHPEWILAAGNRLPPEARYQQVLNLAEPAAFDHILRRLDALLAEYRISYLKWDHNRDLVDAGDRRNGRAAVHAQTLAVYRLLAELRRRHPGVEIESCSSGGGRVDLGILEHTDRVWGSDSNDALERQHINRWTQLLIPPELLGAHVGPPTAHTSGRTQALSFRAATALFGHFGIEWDISAATAQERAELAGWVAVYKEYRAVLHTGTLVRADRGDDLWVHGVVSSQRDRALFAVVQLARGTTTTPGRVRLPGLDPERLYDVRPVRVPTAERQPDWHADGNGIRLTGAALGAAGVQVPRQLPEHALLLDVG